MKRNSRSTDHLNSTDWNTNNLTDLNEAKANPRPSDPGPTEHNPY